MRFFVTNTGKEWHSGKYLEIPNYSYLPGKELRLSVQKLTETISMKWKQNLTEEHDTK